MAPQFYQPLQTALNDTVGNVSGHNIVLEPSLQEEPSRPSILGFISHPPKLKGTPVYNARTVGPDIGSLPYGSNKVFWTKANSVYGRGKGVVRPVNIQELLAIWDYEGKYESKFWSNPRTGHILNRRLLSPPAKMLRSFAFSAGELLLPDQVRVQEAPIDRHGLTTDIPFSPLEEKVTTRLKAAQSDNAEVDLSQWTIEGETPIIARARAGLRKFAAMWWGKHQAELGKKWLAAQDTYDPEDIKAIADCARRAVATTYWSWPRGSRIFFWKFPQEWRNDFRDGVPFWKTSTPPKDI